MSEREQNTPSGRPGRVLRCDEWENLIADALDGTLPAADAAAFTRHHAECALCAQMLKETQQGKAWIEYLAEEPEVPADLLKKILARTSGSVSGEEAGVVPGVPLPVRAVPPRPAAWHRVLPMVRQVARQAFEPRLMMTAAMAFFSIALTLNLTGIKLTEMRAADLRPSRLRATLSRQYYSTNEQVMKYYENLRLVYEMEARVRELRRSTESEPAPRPTSNQTPKQQAPRDGSPSSTAPSGGQTLPAPQGRRTPLQSDAALPAMMVDSRPQHFAARPAEVLQLPASFERGGKKEKVKREVFRALRSTTEDQAERSLV
jgi:Putative zinc-finger